MSRHKEALSIFPLHSPTPSLQVQDALKWNFDQLPDNKLRVFVTEEGGFRGSFWKKALDRKPRLQDSVVFEGDLMKELLDDVRNFFRPETAREYMDKGIPHRLGR